MPFMKGLAPIRRTWEYLGQGRLIFQERVKIVTFNYATDKKLLGHEGARDFVFWYLPQVQYKNPEVQIVSFTNMTPTPFMRCFLDDGEEVIMDVEHKSKEDILTHLTKMLGKSEELLSAEAKVAEVTENPAYFGKDCDRHCICEVPGQVPCPAVVPLPNHMRGKYITRNDQ